MVNCRCGIPDWQRLRLSLGLSRPKMARLLCIGVRTVYQIETQTPHRCPRQVTVEMLRNCLLDPELQRRLKQAGYPIEALELPENAPRTPTCGKGDSGK